MKLSTVQDILRLTSIPYGTKHLDVYESSILKRYSKNECVDAVKLVMEEFSKITADGWHKSIGRVQAIEKFHHNLDQNLNNFIQNSLFD